VAAGADNIYYSEQKLRQGDKKQAAKEDFPGFP
jgi:hypothetical protein